LGVGLALVALVLAMVGVLWYVLLKRRNEDTVVYSVEVDVVAQPVVMESTNSDFDTVSQEGFSDDQENMGFEEAVFPQF
jgi:hypothetical protein